MKSVDLRKEPAALPQILHLAETDSVLVIDYEGHEFIVAQADDFDTEVEALRNSTSFQLFLDQRMSQQKRISIEEIEKGLRASSGQP